MRREVVRRHNKLAKSKVPLYRVRALGCDLGTKNFALTMVDGYRNHCYNTVDATMLQDTISDLTEDNYEESYKRCRITLTAYITYWRPHVIVLERFMNRGRFTGASGEKCSIMIGLITDIAFRLKIHVVLVSASTWKNRFNFWFNRPVKDVYKELKSVPVHLIDAQLQAFYGIHKFHSPQSNPYAHWRMIHGKQLHEYWIKPARKSRSKIT